MSKEVAMNQNNHTVSNQTGAVGIIVAVSLIMFIGFAALSIDVGRRVMVGNEVQNAVDAGALAGASALIIVNPVDNSTSVNPGADAVATAATVANFADNSPVAFSLEGSTVERGHWAFDIEGYEGTAPLGFSANNSTADYSLATATSTSLNGDPAWINAVRVRANTGQVKNFFASILGSVFESFNTTRDAVGYIGFAGVVPPDGVNLPISICFGTMEEDRCSIGRMFPDGDQTARWTDFTQEGSDSGCGTASTSAQPGSGGVGELLDNCTGNPSTIDAAEGISTTNGVVANVFDSLVDCFFRAGPYTPRVMNVTLPVIDCDAIRSNCAPVEGFVNIDIVWVQRETNPADDEDVPRELFAAEENEDGTHDRIWPFDDFVYPDNATIEERWDDLTEDFNLQLQDGFEGRPPLFNPGGKTVYFLPNCEFQEPTGGTGGDFFGILSEIPVLVE
jgi:Flp pilus assembly protein TadG